MNTFSQAVRSVTRKTQTNLFTMSSGDWHRRMYTALRKSIAVNLVVLQYKGEFNKSYSKLMAALQMEMPASIVDVWASIDDKRVYQADYRSSDATKLHRKKKRHRKLKKQDAFVHQEGVTYKSHAFE